MNNDPSNLELLSSQAEHAKLHNQTPKPWWWKPGRKAARGEQSPTAKLTEAQVMAIRTAFDVGAAPTKALAEKYGVQIGTIWAIVKRKRWKHI